MAEIQVRKEEKIFDGITYIALAIYSLFVLVVLGSVLIYTSPDFLIKHLLSTDTLWSIELSLITSLITTALALITGIPAGYCLSRYQFRGKAIVETFIDLPITLPPLVMGLCLLIFFATSTGEFIQTHLIKFVFSAPGIVLAQYSISASFAVIAIRAAYDSIDPRYEEAARTLGCNKVQAFLKITFPLIRRGLISGGVMVWTRAVGEFVPILLLCGAQKGKTDIMPIAIFLQFEQGDVEGAVALTIIFLALASIYLSLFKKLGLKAGSQLRN